MKLLLSSLAAAATLFSTAIGRACADLPKQVQLENSPFYFRSFSINGTSFSITNSEGVNQSFQCPRPRAAANLRPDDNFGTPKAEGTPWLIREGSRLIAVHEEMPVYDDKENPTRTEIQVNPDFNGCLNLGDSRECERMDGDRRMLQIRDMQNRENYLRVYCAKDGNTNRVVVELVRARTIVARASAASRDGMRSLGSFNSANGSMNFTSNEDQGEIQFAGCGATPAGLAQPPPGAQRPAVIR